MLYLVAILAIVIIILTILYTIIRFKNFSYLKNLKKESKYKYYIMISTFCIIIGALLMFDFINIMVVLIHFVLISLLISLIFKIIKINNADLNTLIALAITILYMGYGLYSAYDIRKTTYNLKTDKNVQDLKIAQISDSHLGTTFNGEEFQQHILNIASQNPDLLVITGDYVDDSTTKDDMVKATEVFSKIKLKYGVYFIYGNHDKGYGNSRDFTAEELKEELEKNGVKVLEDEVLDLGNDIILVGRQDKSVSKRKAISELLSDLDNNKYIIVLDHQPNDYENISKTNADLVLSGHTHGGQMFPLAAVGLMIGANDQSYGYEKRNNTEFIVSSGISSWALKFKTGTFSEYVIINVKNSNS